MIRGAPPTQPVTIWVASIRPSLMILSFPLPVWIPVASESKTPFPPSGVPAAADADTMMVPVFLTMLSPSPAWIPVALARAVMIPPPAQKLAVSNK